MTWLRAHHRFAVLAGVGVCLLTACTIPDADKSIAAARSTASPNTGPNTGGARVQGAAGPLSQTESRALLSRIDGGNSDILHRHLIIEQAVAGTPLTSGNAVTVLRDGPETFAAIAKAIQGATHSLNLEYYTIEDVTLEDGAVSLADLLIAQRSKGVVVNIIYDSYGSSSTPADFFTRLAEAGVNLLAYHPVTPVPTDAIDINDRDHRKILVADGRIGVVGGVNLSKNYQSKSPGSDEEGEEAETDEPEQQPANPPAALGDALGLTDPLPVEWRDTAMRIEGPAVADLQALFRDHWNAEHDTPLDETGLFPELKAKGNQVARIIGSSPDEEIPRYYVTLISALRNAESRAWISAAYFVPTPEQKEAMIEAAERGVDMRLLLADDSDSQPAIDAARSHYSDLLEAGVKIYETKGVVLHAKSVVIDGVWSAVGSSNFDYRSVLYNDEVDAIVLGTETARDLESVFEEGMKIATQIDPETWEDDRSLTDRVKGAASRLMEHLL